MSDNYLAVILHLFVHQVSVLPSLLVSPTYQEGGGYLGGAMRLYKLRRTCSMGHICGFWTCHFYNFIFLKLSCKQRDDDIRGLKEAVDILQDQLGKNMEYIKYIFISPIYVLSNFLFIIIYKYIYVLYMYSFCTWISQSSHTRTYVYKEGKRNLQMRTMLQWWNLKRRDDLANWLREEISHRDVYRS